MIGKRLGTAVALGAAALAACATPMNSAGPGDVFVLRHLQAETGSDPALTAEGTRQAQRLASWFKSRDRPSAIYVTRFRRSKETAAPLAERLEVVPIVYDPSDSQALVRLVRSRPGNAVIVGHSNTVPDLVETLGGARPEPIGHDQFGDIWRVSVRSGKTDKLQLEPNP